MNSVGNIYCDRCHARLIPMAVSPPEEPEVEQAPIKGLSLPTIPLEEQQFEDIVEKVGAEEKQAEDWLAQLRGSDAAEEIEPAADDWLAQLRGSDTAEGVRTEAIGAEETGDWLAQLRDADVAAEIGTEEVGAGEAKDAEDWLTQLRGLATMEAEEPRPLDEPVEPVDIPDWLHDLGPVGVEPGVTPSEKLAAETPLEAAPVTPLPEPVLEEPAPPTPAEVPDWLQEMAPPETVTPETALEEAAPIPTVEAPDWLQEITPPEAGVPEPAPEEAVPTPALAEGPDWLQEIAPPEAVLPEAALEEAAPIPTVEVPDWLQEITPPEAAVPEPAPEEAVPTPALAEAPDWLREIAPPEAVLPEAVLEEAAPIPTVEVPDWLQEITPSEAVVPEPAPEEAAPTPTAEVPDWLQEMAPPVEEVAPPPLPIIGAPPSATAEVPEWLLDVAPEERPLPEAAPPISPLVELPVEAKTTQAPDWLSELETEPVPPFPAPTVPAFEGLPPSLPLEPGIEIAGMEEPTRAEIPAWMEALRPREEVDVTAEEEPLETEGLLEGLRGVLAPALAIEAPAIRESVVPAEISTVSLTRAQLLQSLLTQPFETPPPKARKQVVSAGEQVQRWLVAIVLLVAVGSIVIAPQIPMLNIPTLTQPTISPGAVRSYNAVRDVSTGDTALVAFEYGPAEADELNLVAEPVLRHLLDQEAHISIVSTRPEGLRVAAGLLSDIVASGEGYTETQYTLLDYRPGDATGVSQLLSDADTPPNLILVLTAQPGPLRWWIEQAHARGTHAIPIVAGVSAALEPAASPYLDVSAGQLAGTIDGLREAATYEALCSLPGKATQRLNALAAGHIAIVGLMILGAILYTPGGLRRRKK